ncbi:MAG TPA: hypothetical protein VLQ67_00415, partial [Arachnia sp.]|nr:hypothetical protein [Arachnia sp.]
MPVVAPSGRPPERGAPHWRPASAELGSTCSRPTSTPSGPTELRILAARLAEVIEPDQGDADDAKRLAREVAAAHRDR